MNRLLKSLLWTGVYLLQKRDKGVEPVRNPIVETAYQVARRLKGEDRTLLYVLIFAVGVGVGWGWGFSRLQPLDRSAAVRLPAGFGGQATE
jgi:hypothetical protein